MLTFAKARTSGRRSRLIDRRLAAPVPTFRWETGFTLIELLVVIAIMVIMMTLLVPAFTSIGGTNGFTKAVYDIAGILEQARTYAVSNNTYVYVGLEEVDANVSDSAVPQINASASAGGRVAVAVVATKDGTRGYNLSSTLTNPAWTNYNNGAGLVALGKLQRFENVHLVSSLPVPGAGGMLRPAIPSANTSIYIIGGANCVAYTPFSWPLGNSSALSTSAQAVAPAQYLFQKVIQFDPQGIARIQVKTNVDNIVPYMEIGLQPAHGNSIPAAPAGGATGTIAAIQIDSMTGSNLIYRP